MNTNSKQHQKTTQRQQTRQGQGPKKQGQKRSSHRDNLGQHEQEHPETRLTR